MYVHVKILKHIPDDVLQLTSSQLLLNQLLKTQGILADIELLLSSTKLALRKRETYLITRSYTLIIWVKETFC